MNPKLKAIYDELPHVACKGLCHTTCGPVPTSKLEREEIFQITQRRVKTNPELMQEGPFRILRTKEGTNGELSCSYLIKERCSVYEARPLVCRMYGVTQGLLCHYGCKPDDIMPDEVGVVLVERLGNLR